MKYNHINLTGDQYRYLLSQGKVKHGEVSLQVNTLWDMQKEGLIDINTKQVINIKNIFEKAGYYVSGEQVISKDDNF